MSGSNSKSDSNITSNIQSKIFGKPKDLSDPSIFHKLALIPILAWVGLGADGLSSSAYGPEEVFRIIGEHRYLAVLLAFAVIFTVFIISYAYSKIIEHFPNGGGGYMVASKILGEKAGVVSGSALIVDYILTITVSIVSCTDAIFSYIPIKYQFLKVSFSAFLILLLIILNLRGVKESIAFLTPIFIVFILSHILLLSTVGIGNFGHITNISHDFNSGISKDLSSIGVFGILFIVIKAYSIGGGTYTGIEAVSNGLQILREPRVKNGKRTMLYMAVSLSLAAGGLIFAYLLSDIHFVAGKTLNAALSDNVFGNWTGGTYIAFITIFSEGALLLVGAQAGFIDAPRVMANMAVDSWLPRKFASLSEQLTMKNGITIIGVSALLILFYTNGSIQALVLMYSINVFLTFSISQFGMMKFFFEKRKELIHWEKNILIHVVGFLLCITILGFTVFEKFLEGGWLTLLITSCLIVLCFSIKKHYLRVKENFKILEEVTPVIEIDKEFKADEIEYDANVAIQLVDSFNGFGIHTLYNLIKTFPGLYTNIVFVSVGVLDQGVFKGQDSIKEMKNSLDVSMKKYVSFAQKLGLKANYRIEMGTEVGVAAVKAIKSIRDEHKNVIVFSGKLTFEIEKFYHNLLHNQTANLIQKKLQYDGITNVILPIKIM